MGSSSRIYPKAIIIGLAAGLAAGVLIAPLEMLVVFGPSLTGTPLHIASLFLGSLGTLFGAYLAARNAPTDKLANVLVFWAINEFFGLASLLIIRTPFWYGFLGAILVFVATILGWYLENLTRDL
jgi:hypothetical protein